MSCHIISYIILYYILLYYIILYNIISLSSIQNIPRTMYMVRIIHCFVVIWLVSFDFTRFFSKTWWRHRMELQYGNCNKTSTDFFTEWEHKFACISHFDIHMMQLVRNPSHARQEHEYRFTEQSDVLTPDTWMTQTREFGARMIGDLTKRMD